MHGLWRLPPLRITPLLQVKRLVAPGATPADSNLVLGVACRKSLAHKRMRGCIAQPRIILLAGGLELQRGGGAGGGGGFGGSGGSGAAPTSQLSSFDALLDQEQQYLAAAVERIASLSPDVLLVERSVGRCGGAAAAAAPIAALLLLSLLLQLLLPQARAGAAAGCGHLAGAECEARNDGAHCTLHRGTGGAGGSCFPLCLFCSLRAGAPHPCRAEAGSPSVILCSTVDEHIWELHSALLPPPPPGLAWPGLPCRWLPRWIS
jgi:hypothetical protein